MKRRHIKAGLIVTASSWSAFSEFKDYDLREE
jgi:hypothetical protein